jgi:hypothetical protein
MQGCRAEEGSSPGSLLLAIDWDWTFGSGESACSTDDGWDDDRQQVIKTKAANRIGTRARCRVATVPEHTRTRVCRARVSKWRNKVCHSVFWK